VLKLSPRAETKNPGAYWLPLEPVFEPAKEGFLFSPANYPQELKRGMEQYQGTQVAGLVIENPEK
jgi:hypothetical protein